MNPRALVTDVDHLEEVRVETDPRAGLTEHRLVRPRSARGHDKTVDAVLLDQLDQLHKAKQKYVVFSK